MDDPSEGRQNFFRGTGIQRRDKLANSTLRSVFMKQLIHHVTTTYNFIIFWAPEENKDVLVHASLTFNLRPGAGSGQESKVFQHKMLQQMDISEHKNTSLPGSLLRRST